MLASGFQTELFHKGKIIQRVHTIPYTHLVFFGIPVLNGRHILKNLWKAITTRNEIEIDWTDLIKTHPTKRQENQAIIFVNYKKGCTHLAAASDKAYQLLAHGRWFSPDTPAFSTTAKNNSDYVIIIWTNEHLHYSIHWSPWYSWNIAESGVKTPKIQKSIFYKELYSWL
jgi:hypothetical protein